MNTSAIEASATMSHSSHSRPNPALRTAEPPTLGTPGSAVSWGAILAGAAAAAALSLILLILGTGLGLAAMSPWAQVRHGRDAGRVDHRVDHADPAAGFRHGRVPGRPFAHQMA